MRELYLPSPDLRVRSSRLFLLNAEILFAYVALTAVTLILTTSHQPQDYDIWPLWPGAGLATFAVMRFGKWAAPSIFLGSTVANILLIGMSPTIALWVSMGITSAPLIALAVLRWLRPRWSGFHYVRDVVAFIAVMGIFNGAISGLGGALGVVVGWDHFRINTFDKLWLSWSVGDICSILGFTTIFLLWNWNRPRSLPGGAAEQWHLGFTALLILGLTAGLFLVHYPPRSIMEGVVGLLILPFLWALTRFPMEEVYRIGLMSYIIAAVGTAFGRGPYQAVTLVQPETMMQMVAIGLACVGLIAGAMVAEANRAKLALQTANHALEDRVRARTADLQQSHQELLIRESLLFSLSEINRLFASAPDRELIPVLQQFCEILTDRLSLQAVWLGKVAAGKNEVEILAKAGPLARMLEQVHISANPDIPGGGGPTAQVFMTGKAMLFDAGDSHYDSWRPMVEAYQLGGSAHVPLPWSDGGRGVITLYRGKGESFPQAITILLNRLAEDLAVFLEHREVAFALSTAQTLQRAMISAGDIALRARDEQGMLDSMCQKLIDSGLFVAAWIAKPDANDCFVPLASAGELAANALKQWWPASATMPEGYTVGARAWRSDTMVFQQDYLSDPLMAPWRDQGMTYGWRAAAATTIHRQDSRWGILAVIGNQVGMFTPEVREVLSRIAELVGHGLDEIFLKNVLAEGQQKQSYLASHDMLTGLPNRRGLTEYLQKALLRAERHQTLLALGILDLDDFKPINDVYGHAAGDLLLQGVAGRLCDILRASDFVARLGGDEFVLVMDDIQERDAIPLLLDKIYDAIVQPIALADGTLVKVGVSLGLTIYSHDNADTDLDLLLRHADHALYKSKKEKNTREHFWVIYPPDKKEGVDHHLPHVLHLLYHGGLRVRYQPVLELSTGKVVGIEALARLRDATDEIAPDKFLPQLRSGDQWALTSGVIAQVQKDMQSVVGACDNIWVSINVLPKFICNPDDRKKLLTLLTATNLSPQRIILELLESSDFFSHELAIAGIADFRKLGYRIALDDVGSAYASLLRLKNLPVDEIKIDQAFVRHLGRKPEDLYFIKSLLDLGNAMHVDVIVEGAESTEILGALRAIHVPMAQGYAIAAPMLMPELHAWLDKQIPPCSTATPQGLLSLYAHSVCYHLAIQNLVGQAPKLFVDMAPWIRQRCPTAVRIKDLGLEGSAVDIAHTEYRRTLEAIGKNIMLGKSTDQADLQLSLNHFQETLREANRI
ncbi:EAL domain-containing protein [Acidithiobacillus sp.]|uniref:EAL domain-containing protein n=1 Tax=Acidithiobacillus sp. TaxID=1872118 RepID=UPI0026358B2D|nr:EAL domain-containing protein [Acidithiobacillus sp.]